MKQNGISLNSKQIKRMENKKRKLSALYLISSLNEQDKKRERTISILGDESETSKKITGNEFESQQEKKRKFEEIEDDRVKGKPELIKQQLTDEEVKHLRVLIRQRFAAKKNLPKLYLKDPGIRASLDHPKEKRIPIFLNDVQHFILYSLHGHMSTANIPRWITLEKYTRVKNVLVLVVEGMSLADYYKYEHLCTKLKEFTYKLEVVTPLAFGGCLVREMATLPLTESQRHRLEKKFGSVNEAYSSNRVFKVLRTMFPMGFLKKNEMINMAEMHQFFSRTELLLSPWQMLEEYYPLPLEGELKHKYADYVYTKEEYKMVTFNSPMWALDCEMCVTKDGSELVRISIVNENLELVYESFVKPYNPIIDYVTRFSGISAHHLEGVNTRLEDVQATLREIMPPDLILIGHSLNMDLQALKMLHPYCIDTSVIFNLSGERPRKTKLKVLSAEFLGEHIQTNQSGHDSIEDAMACMKLVQEKLKHSIEWGDAVLCGPHAVQQLLHSTQRSLSQHNNQVVKQEQVKYVKTNFLNINTGIFPQIPVIKERSSLPKYIRGNDVAQIEMFTTSLFTHLTHRDKKCLLVAKSSVSNEYVKYMPEIARPFCPESKLFISKQESNKAIIKYGRNNVPEGGVSIMYNVINKSPQVTSMKVDHLVTKLTKNITGNVLVAVLLAGRTTSFHELDTTNHGLLLLKLHQETIPPIQLPRDVVRRDSFEN